MLRSMNFGYGDDDEPGREFEVTNPIDITPVREDTVGRDAAPRPGLRRALIGAAVLAVAASVTVSVIIPDRRQAEQKRNAASYDRLLKISAAGEVSIQDAVSRTRDVVQYAEPLLNSAQTTPAMRASLLVQVAAAARQSGSGIDVQVRNLKAAPASGRLKAAQQATLAYLSAWAAIFDNAAGQGADLTGADGTLVSQHQAALTALVAAAPDQQRADQADAALGAGL